MHITPKASVNPDSSCRKLPLWIRPQ